MRKVNEKSVYDFAEKLSKAKTQIVTETGKALAQCCATIQREAMEEMRDTNVDTSKTYGRKGHHPSLPGNPPAVDTGTLRRSISYEVDEENLVGRVGSTQTNPPYGAYLEFGTSRMQPRPWLRPATEKSMETIKKLLGRAVRVTIE